MKLTCLRLTGLVTVGCLAALTAGCAMFQASVVHPEYRGRLGPETIVSLEQRTHMDVLRTGPEHNYAALFVELRPECADAPVIRECVGRRAVRPQDGSGGFRFGPLQARADESRRRVWIVDESNGRVVCSVDREASTVTGVSDSPPSWARPDAGIVLDQVGP